VEGDTNKFDAILVAVAYCVSSENVSFLVHRRLIDKGDSSTLPPSFSLAPYRCLGTPNSAEGKNKFDAILVATDDEVVKV